MKGRAEDSGLDPRLYHVTPLLKIVTDHFKIWLLHQNTQWIERERKIYSVRKIVNALLILFRGLQD